MTTIQQTIESLKSSAQPGDIRGAGKLAAATGKTLLKQQAKAEAMLAEQQKDLQGLQRELSALKAARAGGGFPWGLLLLAGGAYALYRSNPAVRSQVQNLIDQAGAQDLIEKVKSSEVMAQVGSTVQGMVSGGQSDGAADGAAQKAGSAPAGSPAPQIEKVDHDLTSADISSAREAGQQGAGQN